MALGISLDLGGSSSKSSTTQASTTNKKTTETATEKAQREAQQQTTETTSLLDSETEELLQSLTVDLGESVDAGTSDILTDTLSDRALTADEELNEITQAIIDRDRAQGEQELLALQTQLARQAGGSIGNTLVASSTAQGRADLETQLAGLEAELALQNRNTATQELQTALDAESQVVSDVATLSDILKGSTTTKTSDVLASETSTTELDRLLDETSNTSGVNTTKGSKKSVGGGITGSN